MLNGQKKNRNTTAFDPAVRLGRKAVQAGKAKRGDRKRENQNLVRDWREGNITGIL